MTLGGAEIALSESVPGRDNQQIYLVSIWLLGSGTPVFMLAWHIIQVLSNLFRPSMGLFFHFSTQTVGVYLGVFAFISLSCTHRVFGHHLFVIAWEITEVIISIYV